MEAVFDGIGDVLFQKNRLADTPRPQQNRRAANVPVERKIGKARELSASAIERFELGRGIFIPPGVVASMSDVSAYRIDLGV